jgi:outer membrane lipoprotein SlyB
VPSIREIQEPGRLGALLGTIGGAAGANIGSGTGSIIASSVLSVITGGVGSTVGRLLGGTKTRYEVVARHDDGIDRVYKADSVAGMRPGTVVAVVGGAGLQVIGAP